MDMTHLPKPTKVHVVSKLCYHTLSKLTQLHAYRKLVTLILPFQDSDASIRKRALELIYLLVNESNVKPLAKELIDYLEVSDPEFKGDLTAKICSIVEK